MNLNLITYPAIRIPAAVILFACLCLAGVEADAFRQVHSHSINPQPGPSQTIKDRSFDKWSGLDIINVLKDSGLEVVNVQNGITMGSRAAKETTIFLIPSSGKNIGGFVSSYRVPKALEDDRKYYSGMNKPSKHPVWRIFQRENILLLISGKVSEEKAILYLKALDSM